MAFNGTKRKLTKYKNKRKYKSTYKNNKRKTKCCKLKKCRRNKYKTCRHTKRKRRRGGGLASGFRRGIDAGKHIYEGFISHGPNAEQDIEKLNKAIENETDPYYKLELIKERNRSVHFLNEGIRIKQGRSKQVHPHNESIDSGSVYEGDIKVH